MNIPLSLKNKKILIAGCGGGFDVVCGTPLAIELAKDNDVYFSSYSFTDLAAVSGIRDGNVVAVSPYSKGPDYFPEKHLATYSGRISGCSNTVYCYSQIGIPQLKDIFNSLKKKLNLDVLIVIDGGVDGLFRGDEYDLGSPSIDAISMVAGTESDFEESYYVFTAFGSEGVNKEVSHAEALERIAELTANGGFKGVCSLVPEDETTKKFDECIKYIYSQGREHHQSNIVSSIRASYRGKFGDQNITVKTDVHPIWISPLTSLYWFCDLEKISKMKLYYQDILNCTSTHDVSNAIHVYNKMKKRPSIPI